MTAKNSKKSKINQVANNAENHAQNVLPQNSSTTEEISIGALLKQKREELKMEIRDICNLLKIKTADLESLENNDLKNITKHLYIPGLISSYARAVKLDMKMVEAKIRKLPILSNTDNKDHQLINIGEENDLTPAKDLTVNAFLVAVLLMLILLSFFHSYESRNNLITNHQLIQEMENTQLQNG